MNAQVQSVAGTGKWLALTAALLGWMFDGFEMGLFSMIGRRAVMELMPGQSEGYVGLWFGVIIAGFLVGAATGGVLFGWLGDRMGRVRAMALSVLTYSIFTGLCGFATEAWQVGLLRFIAALGMGGEWSLGVALVMEVWPNRSRAFMAGLIGAAANVGYLLVGFLSLWIAELAEPVRDLAAAIGIEESLVLDSRGQPTWRLLMVLGAAPALLTFLIRLFVPESEKWQHEERKGSTTGWATRDLLGVVLGAIGPFLIIYVWAWHGPEWFPNTPPVRIIGTLLGVIIATVGYLYPVIRYLKRMEGSEIAAEGAGPTVRRMLLGACLSGVALLGTWGSTQWAAAWGDQLTGGLHNAREYTQIWLAVGAIVGTIGSALLGDAIGRRPAYFLQCVLSLVSVYVLFLTPGRTYGTGFLFWAFVAGLCTASFYGWLPLYLPELFRTAVRATGQGFSFNFGRILAAIGVLQTGNLMATFGGSDIVLGPITLYKGYPAACSLMSLIYLVGMVLIWFAPETKGKPLPE